MLLESYEQELFRSQAYYQKKRKGDLIVTNSRLIWASATSPGVP